MNALEIQKMPTLITRRDMEDYLCGDTKGVHESLTRSFHIVRKVKELLEINTPPSVVIEMIEIMEGQ